MQIKKLIYVIVGILFIGVLIFQYFQLVQTKKHLSCVHEATGFSFSEIENGNYDERWANCIERKNLNPFFMW
jgi:hypothetical protein